MSVPARAAGTAYDTSRFGPLMQRFVLAAIDSPVQRDAFRSLVANFQTEHPYETWYRAWQGNSRTFLDTLCWGHDRDLGDGVMLRGAMDDRHITNMERACQPGGLVPEDHVAGRRVCVVGCWSGCELLLLSAMGAAEVDGVEEMHPYARLANAQLRAWDVRGTVQPASLYDVSLERLGRYDLVYMPGVLYHLTDPVAAMLILSAMLVEGGTLCIETAFAQGVQGRVARYLGPSVVGWNWWSPSSDAVVRMMADAGLPDARQVEEVPGRATFVGTRTGPIPLVDRGAAGFSRPDLLHRLRLR